MNTSDSKNTSGKNDSKNSGKNGAAKSGETKPAATGAATKPATTKSDKASAAQTDAEPPSTDATVTAGPLETEKQKKQRLIADAKKKIADREAARERKAKEDAEELALLEKGELPPEKTRSSSGVMAQHTMNKVGAGARHVHKAIASIEESITPETPATPEKTAALAFLRSYRQERMVLWQSKYDERVGAGEEMKHVLPLDLVTDDKGNVISTEKPKKPRAKKGEASSAT